MNLHSEYEDISRLLALTLKNNDLSYYILQHTRLFTFSTSTRTYILSSRLYKAYVMFGHIFIIEIHIDEIFQSDRNKLYIIKSLIALCRLL